MEVVGFLGLDLLFGFGAGGVDGEREKRTSQIPQDSFPRAMRREYIRPRQRVGGWKSLLVGMERPMEPYNENLLVCIQYVFGGR